MTLSLVDRFVRSFRALVVLAMLYCIYVLEPLVFDYSTKRINRIDHYLIIILGLYYPDTYLARSHPILLLSLGWIFELDQSYYTQWEKICISRSLLCFCRPCWWFLIFEIRSLKSASSLGRIFYYLSELLLKIWISFAIFQINQLSF